MNSAVTVGVIGLGSMGSALVSRLIAQGSPVIAWNRNPAPVETAVAEGAEGAATPLQVFEKADVVISFLANDAAVDEVFNEELLGRVPAGTVHVNMATISAPAAETLAARHATAGVAYVGCPVIGRNVVIVDGGLVALCAGTPADRATVQPVLELFCRRVWTIGDAPESANVVKIAINYMMAHALQAMAEAIGLVERYGVDAQTLVDIGGGDGPFPGPIYEGYGSIIAKREYLPAGFTTVNGRKDLGLALQAAEGRGMTLPTGDVLREIFDTALANGQGEMDWSSVVEVTRSPK